MTRRTEITIETDQVVVIRRYRKVLRTWCVACAKKVMMVTAGEAAAATGVSLITVYRWVESCNVHSAETQEGLLFVCLDSLYAAPCPADTRPVPRASDKLLKRLGSSPDQTQKPLAGNGVLTQIRSIMQKVTLPKLQICRRLLSGLFKNQQ